MFCFIEHSQALIMTVLGVCGKGHRFACVGLYIQPVFRDDSFSFWSPHSLCHSLHKAAWLFIRICALPMLHG